MPFLLEGPASKDLLKANIRVWPITECLNTVNFPESYICASAPNRGHCTVSTQLHFILNGSV